MTASTTSTDHEYELPLIRREKATPTIFSRKAERARRDRTANFAKIQTRARSYRIATGLAGLVSIGIGIETQSFGIGYSFFVLFAIGTTGYSVSASVKKIVLVIISYTLLLSLVYAWTESGFLLIIVACALLQTNQKLFPPSTNSDSNTDTNTNSNNSAKAPNISLEQWEAFSQKCQTVAHQVKTSLPGPGDPRLRSPPLDGWYLHNQVFTTNFQLQFIPADDAHGWQIMGQGILESSQRVLIDEGYLSPSCNTYWIAWPKDNPGKSALLFHGTFDPDQRLSVAIHYLDGRISEEIDVVPITQTNCKTHLGVACNTCKKYPIDTNRYNDRSKQYDLCEDCMVTYESLCSSNSELPSKEDFELVNKPELNPFPIRSRDGERAAKDRRGNRHERSEVETVNNYNS